MFCLGLVKSWCLLKGAGKGGVLFEKNNKSMCNKVDKLNCQ